MRRVDGMTPAVARLMALADGSLTRAEVADRLGYTRNGLSATVRVARSQLREPQFIETRLGQGDGSALRLFLHLPPEVRQWLDAAIPEGASAADLVRALIVDAYHEDIAPPVQGEVS